jgi:hypothetical protein
LQAAQSSRLLPALIVFSAWWFGTLHFDAAPVVIGC